MVSKEASQKTKDFLQQKHSDSNSGINWIMEHGFLMFRCEPGFTSLQEPKMLKKTNKINMDTCVCVADRVKIAMPNF